MAVVAATPSLAAEAAGTRLPKHRTSVVVVTLVVGTPVAATPAAGTAASTIKPGQQNFLA